MRQAPSAPKLNSGDDDLNDDEHDNDQLQPQRSLGIDDVGECLGGIGDHGELAGQDVGAFLQFIFVFQPRVKALENRPFPQHVGLFRHGDQTGNAMLNKQRIADVF